MLKLCKDCKYFINGKNIFSTYYTDKCKISGRKKDNLIRGEYENSPFPAKEERKWGQCGIEGKLWEPSVWFKIKEYFKPMKRPFSDAKGN